MASTASKVPLFRTIAARGYAAQPAVAAAGRVGDVHNTTLPNKLVVSSTETGSAISRVSIAVRAGSRNENYDSLGAAHILRIAAGLSTKKASQFGICRNIQQTGGSLSVTGDREILAYTLEVTRDQLETALQFLENSVTGQVFKPWEIQDSIPRIKIDLANISQQARAAELLHSAAFRTALGNSLFCANHKVGKISSETLQHFFASNFTTNRIAVAGVNVDHQMLSGFAQSLALDTGAGTNNQCKFHGNAENRCESGGRTASVAVAVGGAAWANPQEALAFEILQYAGGVGPSIKYGANNGALTKVVSSAAPNTAVSTLNACYSDNGLFGFVVSGPAKEAGAAVEAGVKTLKSCTVSDDDIARGKASLKSAIAFAYETDSSLISTLAGQGAILGSAQSLKNALDAVEAVSASNVKEAARKLTSQKVSVGAAGNLSSVPYSADLN
jgi:ubiquinol-cytochrome c reductase core subunit 2